MADITRRTWLETAAVALTAGASAQAAVPHLELTTRLSLNENPFGPSPLAIAAIREELSSLDRYTADRGDALEAQAAALEGVLPDQIILGEILDALGLQLALAGPRGGEFVYSVPGYTALVDAVSPGGGVTVPVPLNDRLENDLPAMTAKLNSRTRAIYVVNPHNPSGTVNNGETFLDFVRDVAKHTLVIVDEAYLEFLPDFGARTAASLTREGANVIVFRTFGKIYGLAGLSIGYAVTPKALAASLKGNGLGSTLELNRLSVAAASASLGDHGYIPKMRSLVSAEREEWHMLFAKLKLRYADSRGNFVFFETGRPHEEFAPALRSKGVDIGRPFAPLDKWARISIGLPKENALARTAVADILRRKK